VLQKCKKKRAEVCGFSTLMTNFRAFFDVQDFEEMQTPHSLTRRNVLKYGAGALCLAPAAYGVTGLSRAQNLLLDEVERRACLFFWEQADPSTGLVRDRVAIEGADERRVASVAATGFGLSALCIAEQRGYLTTSEARGRAEVTLRYLARKMPHKRGFFYHFVDMTSGARAYECEVSSVDTAWLLCGVLHARAHFDTPRVRIFANDILRRVDWNWMLNEGPTLSHGWTPEQGFLPYRWDEYSELLAMYLLAVSSSTFPVRASTWDNWRRPAKILPGLIFIESPAPLFVHQYSHAWFDFRGKQDGYANYFLNSRLATEAHREFCVGLADRYPWMSRDMWGITASDSRNGYVDWGGTGSLTQTDGTLVPCASGGSLVFLPEDCVKVLETMLDRYGKRVWRHYGFVDAFHPGEEWYAPDQIGIDLGIMLLMAENLRSEAVWRAIMSTAEAARGLQIAGFFASGEV
jgi:hypothetical protein